MVDRTPREGQAPVLIVDEAQGLRKSVLEEIRILLNLETPREKLLQIVLVGHPEVEEKINRPELRNLRQRIACRCKTAPLSLEQTHGYIAERLRIAGTRGEIFTSETIDAVHFYSRGIPRLVNLLCEHLLLNACAEGVRLVPVNMVEEVATEFQLGRGESFSPTYTSYRPPSAMAPEVPTAIPAPIHSPNSTETLSKGMCPNAAPDEDSVALSSWNVPGHGGDLIVPSQNNWEHPRGISEQTRTSPIPTAEAESKPLASSSVKLDYRRNSMIFRESRRWTKLRRPVNRRLTLPRPTPESDLFRWARRFCWYYASSAVGCVSGGISVRFSSGQYAGCQCSCSFG